MIKILITGKVYMLDIAINATVTVVYILTIFTSLFVMEHHRKKLSFTWGLEPASPISVNRHATHSTIIHPHSLTNNGMNIINYARYLY